MAAAPPSTRSSLNDAGIFLHDVEDVGDLIGDAFERGAGEVGGGGAAGDADDGAAGVGIPVRRAETREAGDEVDAAVVGDGGGEAFDVLGGDQIPGRRGAIGRRRRR